MCLCVRVHACVHMEILMPFYEKQLSNGTLYQPSNRHFIMGAVITNTLCRIMMAVVHIVHYTSGCHTALRIYVCACVCVCVCLCFCHFTTSCFSKLMSEPLGRKIYHHLPSVTNNIFWIMIASIGFCICKCEVMNFLCEQ